MNKFLKIQLYFYSFETQYFKSVSFHISIWLMCISLEKQFVNSVNRKRALAPFVLYLHRGKHKFCFHFIFILLKRMVLRLRISNSNILSYKILYTLFFHIHDTLILIFPGIGKPEYAWQRWVNNSIRFSILREIR